MSEQHPDTGYTLVEVLLVILVLGILATVVVAAAGGFTAEAQETGCVADRRILYTAIESCFAQHATDVIPAANATPDGYEQTLVDAELMRGPSAFFDVDDRGRLGPTDGSPCVP